MRSFPCTFCGHSNPPSSVHHPSTNTHTSIHPSIHPHICVHPTLQLAQEWIPGLLAYFHGPLGYFSLGARAVPFTMGCLLGLQRLEPVGWAALRRRDAGVACTTAVVVAAWTAWVPLSRPFLAAGDGPAWPHAGSPRAATPAAAAVMAALGLHGSACTAAMCAGVAATALFYSASPALAPLRRLAALAPLTYPAYLLHVPVMYWLEAWLMPPGALASAAGARPLAALVGIWAACALGTLVAATAMQALLDQVMPWLLRGTGTRRSAVPTGPWLHRLGWVSSLPRPQPMLAPGALTA